MRDKIWSHANLKSTRQATAGTFPCGRSRCLTCTFTGKRALILSTGGGVRLKDRFDYTAASVIYVITCHRCHAMHIGETGRRLSDRFGEHLRSVEGFSRAGKGWAMKRAVRSSSEVWCREGLAQALFPRFRCVWWPAKFTFQQTGNLIFFLSFSPSRTLWLKRFFTVLAHT